MLASGRTGRALAKENPDHETRVCSRLAHDQQILFLVQAM